MINQAKRKGEGRNLPVKFFVQDMGKLSLKRNLTQFYAFSEHLITVHVTKRFLKPLKNGESFEKRRFIHL